MTFKDLITQGGLKVGNLITFNTGEIILVGDATIAHSPYYKNGNWNGWINKRVINVVDLFTPQVIAYMESLKEAVSV